MNPLVTAARGSHVQNICGQSGGTRCRPRARRRAARCRWIGERCRIRVGPPAQRLEPVRDVRRGAGSRRCDVHARDLVQAHGCRHRYEHRQRRHRQRDSAGDEGPRRGGGLERGHELLPRHRRDERQARGGLRGGAVDGRDARTQPPAHRHHRRHLQRLAPRRSDVRRDYLEALSRWRARRHAHAQRAPAAALGLDPACGARHRDELDGSRGRLLPGHARRGARVELRAQPGPDRPGDEP